MTFLQLLKADVGRQHFFSGDRDRAVTGFSVLLACFSPRFLPVLIFRLASWCAHHHLRPIGKVFSLLNFIFFGLEIALDCPIGPGLYFPHTSGTVIGAKRIGANAVIYHNVTLGARVPDLANDGMLRPEIGDGVFLGAGCKVLGPIALGDGVTVGANAVVTKSFPSGSLVGGIPAVQLRRNDVS